MKLPYITLKSLTHIGTLDAADKGVRGQSYEGPGVSVSDCPEAWEHIASLGGLSWWSLDPQSVRLVDGHRLLEEQGDDLMLWGLSNGLLENAPGFKGTFYDDEFECEMSFIKPTLEALQEEIDGVEDVKIEEIMTMPRATAKLIDLMQWKNYDVFDYTAMQLLAQAYAREQGEDGIWWEDQLNEYMLSAPRGVLFPETMARVQFVPFGELEAPAAARPRATS